MAVREAQLLSSLSKERFNEFLSSFDAVLSDCDGVIWEGNIPLKDSVETLNTLRSLGKKLFLVTNNSTKSREQYYDKCLRLGLNVRKEEIISTALLTAQYLKEHLPEGKKAYVIGSPGLEDELNTAGIPNVGVGPDVLHALDMQSWVDGGIDEELEKDIGAVVVGFDSHFSYPKMLKAATYLHDKKCLFISTNKDEQFPTADHIIIPGCGSLVYAVETASGRESITMGKPSPRMFEGIQEKYQLNPARTIMIGDRANTDILLGTSCGLLTLLVLSGVTKFEEIEKWKNSTIKGDKELIPDFYLGYLGELLELIKYNTGSPNGN